MKVFLILILILSHPVVQAKILKEKILIGRVEWIEVPDFKIKVKARVDSGAKTSSLHATNIEEFKRDGQLYVKFITEDEEGKKIELNRKVESTQKVTNATGVTNKRYVIRERIKMGKNEFDILVNLNNRTKMGYKFLIGRNLLFGRFVIDVARSHVLGD